MTDTTAPAQTPARERLEQLRAEAADLADRKAAAADTATTPEDGPRVLKVGETFHAIHDGLTIATTVQLFGGSPAIITRRAQSYVVTEDMLEASKNKFGEIGWPALVHDADAQRRRWGTVYLAPGAAPAEMESFLPGGREANEARENAMLTAGQIADPYERGAAIKRVKARFGAPWNPQVGTLHVRGDSGDEAMRR